MFFNLDTFADVCGVKLEQPLSRYFALLSPCATPISSHPTAARLRALTQFHSLPYPTTTSLSSISSSVVNFRVESTAPSNAIQFRYVSRLAADATSIVLGGDFVQSMLSIELQQDSKVDVVCHSFRG